MLKGCCLCGAIRFEVSGDLPSPTACHCQKCRKHSGHFEASVDIARSQLRMLAAESLRWFHSSEKVRRGFCGVCGSSLFWDPVERDWTSVAMGAFDGATGVKLARHIFVANKGDYYDISDGLPQNAQ